MKSQTVLKPERALTIDDELVQKNLYAASMYCNYFKFMERKKMVAAIDRVPTFSLKYPHTPIRTLHEWTPTPLKEKESILEFTEKKHKGDKRNTQAIADLEEMRKAVKEHKLFALNKELKRVKAYLNLMNDQNTRVNNRLCESTHFSNELCKSNRKESAQSHHSGVRYA